MSGGTHDQVRVYVGGKRIDVAFGARFIDAVRATDAELAGLVENGSKSIVDSRGLPVAPETEVYAGAILRVTAARRETPQSE